MFKIKGWSQRLSSDDGVSVMVTDYWEELYCIFSHVGTNVPQSISSHCGKLKNEVAVKNVTAWLLYFYVC